MTKSVEEKATTLVLSKNVVLGNKNRTCQDLCHKPHGKNTRGSMGKYHHKGRPWAKEETTLPAVWFQKMARLKASPPSRAAGTAQASPRRMPMDRDINRPANFFFIKGNLAMVPDLI